MNNPAIIIDCGYNGLSIIQELGSKGVRCIAVDSSRSIGTFSKYAKFKRCPDPLQNEKEFIECIYSLSKNQQYKPVLIPTNDKWAYAVSKYKDKLKEVSLPCVADFDVIKTLINKDQFYKLGEEEQYMTPFTWSADNTDSIRFPVIAKPVFRNKSSNDDDSDFYDFIGKNRFTFIKNNKELTDFINKTGKYKEYFIFQEFVRGMSDSMYTVGIYADRQSNIKAIFTGKKIRGYPADIGDNVVGESCDLPHYVIENVKSIVAGLKYSGIAEFEYKKDIVSGEYKLIEINPRSWSWIGITPFCGVNIPLITYHDMCGALSEKEIIYQDKERVRYIKLFQDFTNCLIRYRYSKPEWSMSFKEWLKEIKSYNNVYAEIHKKDYLIPIISAIYVVANMLLYKNRTV